MVQRSLNDTETSPGTTSSQVTTIESLSQKVGIPQNQSKYPDTQKSIGWFWFHVLKII